MKTIVLSLLVGICMAGCHSSSKTATREHRGDPARAVTYDGFVEQRTEQLQQMGGPFKDRSVARQKAEGEANSRFGGNPGDSVTTTWTSGKSAEKARAQENFTEELDDMAKERNPR